MLILSRKPQQEIRISENISITVLKVTGSIVRIGISAPRSVHIVRAELPPLETQQTLLAHMEPTVDGATPADNPATVRKCPRAATKGSMQRRVQQRRKRPTESQCLTACSE